MHRPAFDCGCGLGGSERRPPGFCSAGSSRRKARPRASSAAETHHSFELRRRSGRSIVNSGFGARKGGKHHERLRQPASPDCGRRLRPRGNLGSAGFCRRSIRRQGRCRQIRRPQTTWEGPTKGPKPEPGKKIVFLSGDEQNDISQSLWRLHQGSRREAGLERDRHRREREPDFVARRHEPGDCPEAGRHRTLRRRGQPARPDQGRSGAGHQIRRPSRRGAPEPQPDLNLFVNIQEDRAKSARRRRIGRSQLRRKARSSY